MSAGKFLFGEFEFDCATRILTQKGRNVKLQAQPALLLSVLLERSNQVVSREELKQAIWGEDTYVDFEKGLNFCMGQVRSALRDDASRPVYIRTLPRQGYQFVAPVRKATNQVSTAASPPMPAQEPRERARPRWMVLGGAAVVLTAVVTVAAMFLPAAIAGKAPNVAVVRFDAETSVPAAQTLADSLTDDVVVQLASRGGGHYRVVGNAGILRVPREQRDLANIASSLHCSYAVLGQVRVDGNKLLFLAHLIRLSDMTHIEVVRIERKLDDPMAIESLAVAEVAARFAARMANHPELATSFPSAAH